MTDIDTSDATLGDFCVDQRVEVHPCTDFWMQGDRFGYVTRLDRANNIVHVKMDRSGRTLRLFPKDILKRMSGA